MSLGDTVLAAEQPPSLDWAPAVELADLLLLTLARRKAVAIAIEPSSSLRDTSPSGRESALYDRRALRVELAGSIATFAALDAALADAVVARLAILADLDVGASREQVGRLRVRERGATGARHGTVDLLVVIRSARGGLIAELRRIPSAEDPPIPQPVLDGDQQTGNYRIVGELGRGGMGVVYLAEHVILQKQVALKVLYPGLASHPEIAARFVLEARAACRIKHPGIIDVTDFGRLADGRTYFVMERVIGETLEVMLRRGPLDPVRALAIAAQLGDALGAAALGGVVHRDLKPANIFVSDGDRVRIGDFGLAQMIEPRADGEASSSKEPKKPGRIAGTAWYMSPEQARGAATDARSDIYSLGCVLFEMLTGKVPYDGATISAIFGKHAAAPIPRVEGPDGTLPVVVERVIARAMAKRPRERYQSARELIADIELAARAIARRGWRQWLPT